MRNLEYIWKLREVRCDEGELQEFCNQLNGYLSPSLASMMLDRVGDDVDAVRAFLRPSLSMLHDPFLYRDMDKAIDRLCAAIEHDEKILVYGDYDVDGTTSVA